MSTRVLRSENVHFQQTYGAAHRSEGKNKTRIHAVIQPTKQFLKRFAAKSFKRDRKRPFIVKLAKFPHE